MGNKKCFRYIVVVVVVIFVVVTIVVLLVVVAVVVLVFVAFGNLLQCGRNCGDLDQFCPKLSRTVEPRYNAFQGTGQN